MQYKGIMFSLVFIVVFNLFLMFPVLSAEPNSTDVQNVLDFLETKVDKRIRPVVNQSKPIYPRMTFHILTITDFDEVKQKLSCTGWLDIRWEDEFMTWKWKQYNGVKHVFPPLGSHWLPVIGVANSYSEMRPLGYTVAITKVYWNGTVRWYPAETFMTSCKVDISRYPYDTQTCLIEIMPWGRSAEEVTLTVDKGVVLNNYRTNGEWDLLEVDMQPMIISNGWMNKSFLHVKLVIRRRPTFYALNVILPVLLLSLLNILVFILPAECGERVSYSVTVLLALAVFLSFITETMPKTAESVSLLSVYLTGMLFISTCSVAGSIFNLVIYHRNPSIPIPRWLVRLVSKRHRQKKVHATPQADPSSPDIQKVATDIQWRDVARCVDGILYLVSMIVILPTTCLVLIMIFVF